MTAIDCIGCGMHAGLADLPAWDPRIGWDSAEEERPAPRPLFYPTSKIQQRRTAP